ncbi:hypothetical protein [Streptomyces sp. SP18ES09]|uniref:hypothetical protein n=1 Tax=Streptomyces sp. SP18ES09 TaxID=3002532 RepID=UPI002E79FFFC|nr:hypothetical protein [Streptomyces sp. SP18ES09]
MHVEAVDLHGEAPIAVRDTKSSFTLGIDFSQPPEHIAATLAELFQEAVDSNRWHRRGTCEQHQAERRATPHPESGPY